VACICLTEDCRHYNHLTSPHRAKNKARRSSPRRALNAVLKDAPFIHESRCIVQQNLFGPKRTLARADEVIGRASGEVMPLTQLPRVG